MPSGSRKVSASRATACSAKPPWASIAMTRSPGWNRRAPRPRRSTTPAASSPGLNGNSGLVWYWPLIIKESAKLTVEALTPITTSPGPGSGSGTSSIVSFSGPPHSRQTTARIAVLPLHGLLRWRPLAGPRFIWEPAVQAARGVPAYGIQLRAEPHEARAHHEIAPKPLPALLEPSRLVRAQRLQRDRIGQCVCEGGEEICHRPARVAKLP